MAAAAVADIDSKEAEDVVCLAYSEGLVTRCPGCGRIHKHYHAGYCMYCAPPL